VAVFADGSAETAWRLGRPLPLDKLLASLSTSHDGRATADNDDAVRRCPPVLENANAGKSLFHLRLVYPKHFFREVPRHWPGLALWCMVEEESSAFGGIVTVREGRRRDLVNLRAPATTRANMPSGSAGR